MVERPDNILSYGRRPRRFALRRRQLIIGGGIALGLLLGGAALNGPTREDIRLDTGDIRYVWLGVPLEYRPMAEPQRSKLLALAAKSPTRPEIPATWVVCVEHPPDALHGYDSMCTGWYRKVAAWSVEDQQSARWALEALSDGIKRKRDGTELELNSRIFFSVAGKEMSHYNNDD